MRLEPAVRLGLRLCVLDVMREALEPAEAPDVPPTVRVTAPRGA